MRPNAYSLHASQKHPVLSSFECTRPANVISMRAFAPCGSLFFFVASSVTSQKCVPERGFRPPNPHLAANGVRSDTRTMQASQNHGAPRLAGRTRAKNVLLNQHVTSKKNQLDKIFLNRNKNG